MKDRMIVLIQSLQPTTSILICLLWQPSPPNGSQVNLVKEYGKYLNYINQQEEVSGPTRDSIQFVWSRYWVVTATSCTLQSSCFSYSSCISSSKKLSKTQQSESVPCSDLNIFRIMVNKKMEYWYSYWSYLEWFIILVSMSAIGFYFYKVDI